MSKAKMDKVNWKEQKSKFHTNFIKRVVEEYGKWLKENSEVKK